jgi:hypothetical protein
MNDKLESLWIKMVGEELKQPNQIVVTKLKFYVCARFEKSQGF